MNKFFKKNQKKFLALFSAGLMIAFALPSAVSNVSKSRDVVVGYAGKQKVIQRDLGAAREQWLLLKNTVSFKDHDSSGQPVQRPILDFVFGSAAAAMEKNPEMYHLLLQEAAEMGITVGHDEIESAIINSLASIDDGQGSYLDREREALRGLLSISAAARRASEATKITRPMRDHTIAERQRISLNLVQFNAKDYLAKLPTWSDIEKAEKVKTQFEAYRNLEPTTQPSNEFGFGYKVPNQIRVQYIELPQDAIRKAAASKITEIEARKYHLQNPLEFPSTQPVTMSEAALKAAPPPPTIAAPGATTQPSIPRFLTEVQYQKSGVAAPPKFFDEYREEIYKKLTDDRGRKLTQDILTEINTQISTDYAAFKAAIGTDVPATATTLPSTAESKAPKTPFGVPYNSYEYLQKLAQRIQEKYGILPPTYEDKGLRTAKQLSEVSGIGKASVQGYDIGSLFRMMQMMGLPKEQMQQQFQEMQQIAALATFPVYASALFEPFAPPQVRPFARKWRLRLLSLLEPSPLLQDRSVTGAERDFIFRIVESQLAHPAEKDDVFEQVVADARLADAYKLAQQDAALFAKAAQQLHLARAAEAAGKPVITTDAFGKDSREIDNFKLPDPMSTATLIGSAFNLLSRGEGGNEYPIGVIDVRPAAMVVVAELNQIRPPWTAETLPEFQAETAAAMERQLAQQFNSGWFSYPNVLARTHYRAVEMPNKKSSSPEQAPQPDDNPLR